jgi:hypothetical protein
VASSSRRQTSWQPVGGLAEASAEAIVTAGHWTAMSGLLRPASLRLRVRESSATPTGLSSGSPSQATPIGLAMTRPGARSRSGLRAASTMKAAVAARPARRPAASEATAADRSGTAGGGEHQRQGHGQIPRPAEHGPGHQDGARQRPGPGPVGIDDVFPAGAQVAVSSPMAVKIQPMALPGRWATIKAPTTMNALTPTSSTRKPAGSCWKLALATEDDGDDHADDEQRQQRQGHPGPAPAHGAASLLGRPEPHPANRATFHRGTVPRSLRTTWQHRTGDSGGTRFKRQRPQRRATRDRSGQLAGGRSPRRYTTRWRWFG